LDSGARDHHARARQHAVGVALDDAAVRALGGAEVVGVEDHVAHQPSPTSTSSRRATAPASKCSAAIARAASQWGGQSPLISPPAAAASSTSETANSPSPVGSTFEKPVSCVTTGLPEAR